MKGIDKKRNPRKNDEEQGGTPLFVKARVIATGKIIEVDDSPVWFGFFKCYCMWHCDREGNVFHDEELQFLGERLQK